MIFIKIKKNKKLKKIEKITDVLMDMDKLSIQLIEILNKPYR